MSETEAASAKTPTQHRYTVLVVDDEPDHRLLIERRLREARVQVVTAESGDEALTKLDGVDLVLLDYVLPGRSGLDTLRSIRQLDGPSVILVTAMGSESIVIEAMRSGAVDYLIKDQSYLTALPQVVERAWRAHDLARRSREMQRMALLVSSATDKDAVFGELVRGAGQLLRAEECCLFLVQGDGLILQEAAGSSGVRRLTVREKALAAIGSDKPVASPVEGATVLSVPVRGADHAALGVLAVVTDGPGLVDEEVSLAVTFASFCGLAIGHVKQLELERSVVEELQEMLELRRELVASVSHELRTPLTCILGFASTLSNHWPSLADDVQQDFVSKIHKHGLELAELVDGLLDFASAEAGRLAAENRPVDVREVVDETLTQLAPMLSDREVSVSGDALRAAADPILLRRALSNLLSNAVKYSAGETPIAVDVTGDGPWVKVSVIDRGVGLTPDELDRVFEPFWRAGRGISRKRGTGIGLGLVKDYVRLMGGTVSVESVAGEGSTFSFTLPALPG